MCALNLWTGPAEDGPREGRRWQAQAAGGTCHSQGQGGGAARGGTRVVGRFGVRVTRRQDDKGNSKLLCWRLIPRHTLMSLMSVSRPCARGMLGLERHPPCSVQPRRCGLSQCCGGASLLAFFLSRSQSISFSANLFAHLSQNQHPANWRVPGFNYDSFGHSQTPASHDAQASFQGSG